MMTWVPGQARDNVPSMTHGEGVYLYDDKGNEYLDWTSQAVCANLGHSLPAAVIQAAAKKLKQFATKSSGSCSSGVAFFFSFGR